jgi:hypothetical protein
MTQAAWYVQDDIQLRPNLNVGVGLRHEWQSHLDEKMNLAPRFSFSWTPSESGRTTLRGAAGIFHEWYEGSTFEETVQVDGTRVQDVTIQFPAHHPDPFVGGILDQLPVGRVQQSQRLQMPTVRAGGRSSNRIMTELYVRALNVLNTVNSRGFSGVLSSPFLGKPTSAEPARRLEVGVQISM